MNTNEEFEKLMDSRGLNTKLAKRVAAEGWNARQPEIDALKQKVLELEGAYDGCEKANDYNKAVINRLGELNDSLKDELGLCHGTLESRERNIETLAEENAALKAEIKALRDSRYAPPLSAIREREIKRLNEEVARLNSALMRDAISDIQNVERVEVFPVYAKDEKLRKAAEQVLKAFDETDPEIQWSFAAALDALKKALEEK